MDHFCMSQQQKRTAQRAAKTETGYLTSHPSHGSQLTVGLVSRGHTDFEQISNEPRHRMISLSVTNS